MWCCPSLTRNLKWLACRDKAAAHALGHPVRVERGRHGLVSTRSPSSRASCMVLTAPFRSTGVPGLHLARSASSVLL